MRTRPQPFRLAVCFALLAAIMVCATPPAHATVDDSIDDGLKYVALGSAIAAATAAGLDFWVVNEIAEGDGVSTGLRAGTGAAGGVSLLLGGFTCFLGTVQDDGELFLLAGGVAVIAGTAGIVLASIADSPEDVAARRDLAVTPWLAPALAGNGEVTGWQAGASLHLLTF